MKLSFGIVFLVLVAKASIWAQFSDEYNLYKRLYPDDDKVRLKTHTDINIQVVNNEIDILLKYYEEDLYLNSSAHYYSEKSVDYSTFYELKDIEASTLIFDKSKYREQPIKTFTHKDDLSGYAFYDDSKTVNFIFPNLSEGAKSILRYEEKIMNPRFLSSYFIGSFFPVINSRLTITADKNISLVFKNFNTDSLDLGFSQTEKNGKIIYEWNANNIEEYETESNSVGIRNNLPHIVPIITSYQLKDKKIELLNEVSNLYQWYYQLTKDINKEEPNEEMVNVVNTLIQDKSSEMEKVKAIYYWVQQNIKYVAFEYALGGFIPRDANDIFNKKYGDCKDNSSILKMMLEIAGIKGHLTWVGTRDLPYTYAELPAPGVDNHMILTYFNDTALYFLDATGRFQNFNLPTAFIQGKEALISIDSSKYVIKKVPVIDAEKSYYYDSLELNINNVTLTGKGRVKIDGYTKISYYNALERIKSQIERKDFYNRNFMKGSNKFLINEFTELSKYDYDNEFMVDYSFNIDNYIHNTENEIYVNLNLEKSMIKSKIKKEDKLDKEFNFKNYTKYNFELIIPEGYTVEYIPEDASIEYDKFSSHIKYTRNENSIIYEHDIKLDYLILKKEEHKDFNEFINRLDKAYKESVVLKKEKL